MSEQVLYICLFACIAISVVAPVAARAWVKVRKATTDAALKQEMLRRGLSVEEMERVLRAAEPVMSEEAAHRALGEVVAGQKISAAALEETVAAFRAADAATKREVVQLLQGIATSTGALSEETLLAVVRGLRPAAVPPPAERPSEFVTRAVP